MAVLALLAGWLVAGRMLRPIRTITGTARRISSSNLHERLALEGPNDELKELGDTLDGLSARLEAAFGSQRHFVANASHELRTPLTAERALLQVALHDPDTTAAEWRSTAEEVLASNRRVVALADLIGDPFGAQRPQDRHRLRRRRERQRTTGHRRLVRPQWTTQRAPGEWMEALSEQPGQTLAVDLSRQPETCGGPVDAAAGFLTVTDEIERRLLN